MNSTYSMYLLPFSLCTYIPDLCTFTQSGKTYIQQPSYKCKTCDMADPSDSICSTCIKICHAGHDTERQDYIGGSFCDCGVQGDAICRALGTLSYKQSFQGGVLEKALFL